MAVRVVGLICGEVARVDLAPVAMRAGRRGGAGRLEKLDDARVGGGEPPRKLHRIALIVPPFLCDRVLVVRRDRRPVLVDASLHPVGEDLGRVGHVPDDLERGPLIELRLAQAVRRHCPNDPRDCRGIVRQEERLVLVVAQPFHVLLLSRMYELAQRKWTTPAPSGATLTPCASSPPPPCFSSRSWSARPRRRSGPGSRRAEHSPRERRWPRDRGWAETTGPAALRRSRRSGSLAIRRRRISRTTARWASFGSCPHRGIAWSS